MSFEERPRKKYPHIHVGSFNVFDCVNGAGNICQQFKVLCASNNFEQLSYTETGPVCVVSPKNMVLNSPIASSRLTLLVCITIKSSMYARQFRAIL